MLVTFRSVAIAVRLALTICLTLSWCYGGGVIVFVTGIFSGANDSMAETRALSWLYAPSLLLLWPVVTPPRSPVAVGHLT